MYFLLYLLYQHIASDLSEEAFSFDLLFLHLFNACLSPSLSPPSPLPFLECFLFSLCLTSNLFNRWLFQSSSYKHPSSLFIHLALFSEPGSLFSSFILNLFFSTSLLLLLRWFISLLPNELIAINYPSQFKLFQEVHLFGLLKSEFIFWLPSLCSFIWNYVLF